MWPHRAPMGPQGPPSFIYTTYFYIFKISFIYKVFPLYFFQELNSKLSQLERVRFSQDFRFFKFVFDFFLRFQLFLHFFYFWAQKNHEKVIISSKTTILSILQLPKTGSGSDRFRFIPVPVHTGSGSYGLRFPGQVPVHGFPEIEFLFCSGDHSRPFQASKINFSISKTQNFMNFYNILF